LEDLEKENIVAKQLEHVKVIIVKIQKENVDLKDQFTQEDKEFVAIG